MNIEFDSESQQLEDERIIVRAFDLIQNGEKLRWPAQKNLAHAAARMAARVSLRCSTGASTENEQHESDDRQDDENRPQHDGDSTQWADVAHVFQRPPDGLHCFLCGLRQYDPVHVAPGLLAARVELTDVPGIVMEGRAYKIVTPEIQAVLDALPEWVETIAASRSLNALTPDDLAYELFTAGRAYLASIEPAQPETVYPERWMVVWPKGVGYANRAEAEDAIKRLGVDPGYDALGILHLRPDGSTVMEPPS